MTAKMPSKSWRLVLSIPTPKYETYRSKDEAYRAVEQHLKVAGTGLTRVVGIAVDKWDVDKDHWTRFENVWKQ